MERIQDAEQDMLSLEFARRLQAEEYGNNARDPEGVLRAEFEAYGAVSRQSKPKTTKKAKIEAAELEAVDLTTEEPVGAYGEASRPDKKKPTRKTKAAKVDAATEEAMDLRQEQLHAYGEALRQDKIKTAKKAEVEAAKVEAAKVEAAQVEAAQVEAAQVEAAQVEAPSLAEMRLLRIKAFSKPTAN
jgi:D-gamma-glutamyl-meso-diaminopimelic acid endopeptidase CwlS